ncbi:PepSY-associated TM helix domain-containing protein [Methylosinus sp. LW4]|uniref:PepSY-associated TM helix domain-containing protein n=1 Tax=Methylosinus sp. LW4 TaxID=136993 RepID=UPI000376B59D|nr:PepSY-associated TM helix domain-containing protein [Methylosinus sp. LW4]
MIRRAFVVVHRWVGLLLAGFLLLEGLTGALLAFNDDLERLISPQLYAELRPDQRLDLSTIAERVEAAAPDARLAYMFAYDRQIVARCIPRKSAETGVPLAIGFTHMFLDPWTGEELGRRRNGDLSQGPINLMSFVYELHMQLALGPWGAFCLGVVALVWTLDCFYALYLTLPQTTSTFWRRWKSSWLVKWRAGAFRLNFDLHRAGGLWFWPLFVVFAWSGVMFDWLTAYEAVTRAVLPFRGFEEEIRTIDARPKEAPRLGWRAALVAADRGMKDVAQARGATLGAPFMFGYIEDFGAYTYGAKSDLDIQRRNAIAGVWVDGDTGAVVTVFPPIDEPIGNTLSNWLRALHFGDLGGSLLYRIVVCLCGVVVAIVSTTGVYIWWRKRRARTRHVQAKALQST